MRSNHDHLTMNFVPRSPHIIIPTIRVLLAILPLSAVATWQSPAQSSSEPPNSDQNELEVTFNPLMAVIIVVLVCAFFFIGFLSIYIRHCTDTSAAASATEDDWKMRVGGLDPSVIATFPIFQYSYVKDLRVGKGALECAVCISEFKDDDTLRLLPKCDHVFHRECIDAWLDAHDTCPVCRANLTLKDDSGEKIQSIEQIDQSVDEPAGRSEETQVQNQVSVGVEDGIREVQVVRESAQRQNRRFVAAFSRSHSTGHSLVRLGENSERYTLRLPEEVRRQILTLKRTTSCVVVSARDEGSRRGYRSGGEGSSRGKRYSDRVLVRSDRWVFTMTPPFISRTGSVCSPKVVV